MPGSWDAHGGRSVDLGSVIGPRHGFGFNKQDAELVDIVR
jgi:hypothetical protein